LISEFLECEVRSELILEFGDQLRIKFKAKKMGQQKPGLCPGLAQINQAPSKHAHKQRLI